MRMEIIFDSSKCIGCLYCEMICSFRHKGVFRRDGSLIRIATNEKSILHDAFFCAHCHTPVCAALCQLNCISVNDETGLVSVDTEQCTGCGLCISGCPRGGMFIDQESAVAMNCDLCQGNPACIVFCPSGALQYVTAVTDEGR